jgi:hypothetical protein
MADASIITEGGALPIKDLTGSEADLADSRLEQNERKDPFHYCSLDATPLALGIEKKLFCPFLRLPDCFLHTHIMSLNL